LNSSHKLFGRERETVDEAYPGDIIGIVGHSEFGVGDTLTEDESIRYDEIPRFTPESFIYLSNPNPYKSKRFAEGLDQLLQEGVAQELMTHTSSQNSRLLAAVGPLQFDVIRYRLETEYGAETRAEPAPWKILRWVSPQAAEEQIQKIVLPTGCQLAATREGQRVLLFHADWELKYFAEKNTDLEISRQPFTTPTPAAAR
jgi:peptide chain release factor 3